MFNVVQRHIDALLHFCAHQQQQAAWVQRRSAHTLQSVSAVYGAWHVSTVLVLKHRKKLTVHLPAPRICRSMVMLYGTWQDGAQPLQCLGRLRPNMLTGATHTNNFIRDLHTP